MGSKMIDRTIDMLLRNLRTEVARLETALRLSQNEADGLRYQLQRAKSKQEMEEMIDDRKA
jgi:ribosomal protein L29